MNKQLLLIFACIVLSSTTLIAQNAATPNPSFENWTQNGNHWDPDNWNTLNPNTSIVGVLTCTRATGADVHTGTYAIKLTTKSVFTVTANGIATTATLITTPPYGVTGGLAYTQRPDSIVGWYKCTPLNGDHGFVEFSLFDSNNDTTGYVRFNLPSTTVGTYTRFSAAINYFNTNTPVLSQWILSSSGPSNQVVNSSAVFDDIDLIINPSVLNENTNESFHFIYDFNSKYIKTNCFNNKTYSVEIFDIAGKTCFYKMYDSNQVLPVDFLTGGLYIVRLSNDTGETFTTKIIR